MMSNYDANHDANHDAENNVVTKSITVERDLETVFQIWTEQIRHWWPTSHSISGDPQTQVFVEGKVAGRFFERSSNGDEYDWGTVEVWHPPYQLAFTWYLGSDQTLPTRVKVDFVALDEKRTLVKLEQRGPELIGELWWQRVDKFNASWDSVLAKFTTFLQSIP